MLDRVVVGGGEGVAGINIKAKLLENARGVGGGWGSGGGVAGIRSR